VVLYRRTTRGGVGGMQRHSILLQEVVGNKKLMEECANNGRICLYFVCDFNGRWLNDLSFFLLCLYSTSRCVS
jgi:hypothetical protein